MSDRQLVLDFIGVHLLEGTLQNFNLLIQGDDTLYTVFYFEMEDPIEEGGEPVKAGKIKSFLVSNT